MGIDTDRVVRKCGFILEQVKALRDLTRQLGKDAILNDPWVYRGVKYALQTAIEALVDVAYHVSAKEFAHAPTDARDALQVLRAQKVISEEDYAVYSAMVGMRNRIVHGYETVDPERVYEVITTGLADLERFVREITGLNYK